MKQLIPYAICIVLGLLLARECNRKPQPETITKTITVTVPEIIKQFDTVFKPVPNVIRETDTIILKEFLSAKDSVRIAMYVNATLEREYTETFRDSTQEINVWTKTRGKLLEQTVDYRIFPSTITHTETIEIPRERNFYLLPQAGYNPSTMRVKASGSLLYQDRQKRLYSLSADTDGFILAGFGVSW